MDRRFNGLQETCINQDLTCGEPQRSVPQHHKFTIPVYVNYLDNNLKAQLLKSLIKERWIEKQS